MVFELKVVRNTPLTGERNLEEALKTFLKQIGYLPESYEEDVGFKLMADCFLAHPEKPWTVDELLTVLEANRSTLYRYLNKLKGLDLLDETSIPLDSPAEGPSKKTRKGYTVRFNSLSLAWTIVESHTKVAMENYRRSVDHIDQLVKDRLKGKDQGKRKRPSVTVDGILVQGKESSKEILFIKRGREPYKGMWALPGGFIDCGETAENAIIREMKEETSIECTVDGLMGIRSSPNRDPRGHTITLVYKLSCDEGTEPKGGDDATEARYFPLDDLPPLAFDHLDIIEEFIKENISPNMVQ